MSELRKHSSLPKQTLSKLRSLFDGIEVAGPLAIKVGVSTRAASDLLGETIRSVDEHLEEGRVLVIAMDEVPIAIGNIAKTEGPAAANQLLQTLRRLRRRGSKLRWIVSGSVGFHHVLRSCGATEGVLNDLVNLPLGPLEPEEATELAQRLFLGIAREADPDAVQALVEQSGRIPFLMHGLAHRLRESGSGPASVRAVEEAFVEYMDDRDDSRAATHLLSRIPEMYGDRAPAAEELLDRVARAGPVEAADLDGDLLNHLIDDHYLAEKRGLVSWRYDVLKRIWAHRRRLR